MRAGELPRHGGAPGHSAWGRAGPHRQPEQVRQHQGPGQGSRSWLRSPTSCRYCCCASHVHHVHPGTLCRAFIAQTVPYSSSFSSKSIPTQQLLGTSKSYTSLASQSFPYAHIWGSLLVENTIFSSGFNRFYIFVWFYVFKSFFHFPDLCLCLCQAHSNAISFKAWFYNVYNFFTSL